MIPLLLGREQVLAYRRRVGSLDRRLPYESASLRRVAWAGLQDSVPRAALLALHARVHDVGPSAWEDPSLVQVWGPRHSVFVVAAEDRGVFTLGTAPEEPARRVRGESQADRLEALLGDGTDTYSHAGRAIGEQPVMLRYAGATGRVLVRWDGARQPTIRIVPRPALDLREARLELARRFLHVAGPATLAGLGWWAGMPPRIARDVLAALTPELVAVRTPVGEGWVLATDERAFRADAEPAGATEPGSAPVVRLLSSGDPYLMAGERELLVADDARRRALWPPATVWPGGVLLDGELVGTWRRAGARMTVRPWLSLTRTEREAVAAEAASLRLPEVPGPVAVAWDEA